MTAFMNLRLIEKLAFVEIKYGTAVENFFYSMIEDIQKRDFPISYTHEDIHMNIKNTKFMDRRPKLSLFDLFRIILAIFFLLFSALKKTAVSSFRIFLEKLPEKAIKTLILVSYGLDIAEYLVFTSFIFDGAFECVTI